MREAATDSHGPDWLTAFLIDPPLWFKVGLVLAALACVGLAAREVWRRDIYISREEMRDVALILGTVEGVAVGVVASMRWLALGFVGDVLCGLVAGFLGVEIVRRVGRAVLGRVVDEATELIVAWWVLVLVALGSSQLTAQWAYSLPPGTGYIVGGIAGVMLFWTLIQEFGPEETVGEAIRTGQE